MPRLALAPFPLLALIMGLGYLAGDPERTNTPSFTVAKAVGILFAGPLPLAPIQLWGAVFLAGATVLTVALALDHDRLLHAALAIGGGIYTWWAIVLGAAFLHDGSANAWSVYAFVAITHYVAAHHVKVPR